MSPSRTFKLTDGKPMRGDDVKEWQKDVKAGFKKMDIDCPIKIDGIYGQSSRGFSASFCEAMGLVTATAMKNGVTPELRVKLRNRKLSTAELNRKNSKARKDYRAKLRARWKKSHTDLVHAPISKIVTDDWGFVPGVHDGIDVTSDRVGAAAFAMVRAKVIDVRAGNWARPPATSIGDGIVQLEVLDNNGPFKKGQHIGYGHVEHARVKVGQIVQPGEVIALVGSAVTPHIHLMVNDGKTTKGIGNINPRKHLDYAIKHG